MKHLLLIMFSLSCLTLNAQTSGGQIVRKPKVHNKQKQYSQHISFMDIQLGQSESIVDRMLQQKGFRYVGVNNAMLTKMYDGTFWKFQNTRLNTEVNNGVVTAIRISPSYEIYDKISYFNDLVYNLDRKHGSHRNISDFFKSSDIAGRNGFYWRVSGGYIATYYAKNPITEKIIISIDYLDNTDKRIILESGSKRNTNNDL